MSALAVLTPGGHRLACPSCARRPNDRTFGVTVERDGAAVGHCFRCKYVEKHRPGGGVYRTPGKVLSRPVAPLKRETLSEHGTGLFDACAGLRGTIAEQYLLARRCGLPPADGDLRFHPSLRHPASGHVGPALVALVTHAATGEPISLHRTWIRADGRKAECDPPRMLLGGHAKKHGVIRLWPDEAVNTGLAVAEGIETALSLDYAPAWACIDAGNLAGLPVLAGIEVLVIGADHDEAGMTAATACADRWAAAGVDVRLIAPDTERCDWNDARAAA